MTSKTTNVTKHILLFSIFLFFGISTNILAATSDTLPKCPDGERYSAIAQPPGCILEFVPLVGIPYIEDNTDLTLPGYINALYVASISIAAFLAVVKIIFAGVKYMLSDVVTDKGAAKKDIRGALIGLLIVVGAVLILNTINPQLKELTFFEGMGVEIETRGNIQPQRPCTQEATNPYRGTTQCIARGGDACDTSVSGGV